ncbi:hypothetical protein [Mycobacterium decipiens]|uniref:Integral membrane protein n=1 Tax=Mycobacterium decipiens TaxID=1430326 RepID=A0A1X2M0W2_9MYCO|nr:hypothetical protein [Mycobacterium decipiens]OSC43182.1 hypothetical protein B8W66_02025 [Mycobacterium decipiens]
MTSITQPGARVFATVFGLMMVGSTAVGSHGFGVVAGVAAAIAVGVGTVFRVAATLAVLLSVLTIVVSGPTHVLAASSGLCAAAYLVCRYAPGTASGIVVGSWPTTVAAVGFAFAGLAATSFPLQVPWLPLAAPLAVLAIYVLVTRPFSG